MNEWVKRIKELERENARLKDDIRILKNIRSIRTEEWDKWKQVYDDLLSTNEVLKDMATRKN
jgi:hypothetical protein